MFTKNDLEQANNFSKFINEIIERNYEEMNKKNLETVMKKEYQKGTAKYNRLWDALQLLFRLGLVSVSEMDNIKTINHDLSKLHN